MDNQLIVSKHAEAEEKGKGQQFLRDQRWTRSDLNQINYDTDKDTIIKRGRDVIKKLNSLPVDLHEFNYLANQLKVSYPINNNIAKYYSHVYNCRNRKRDKNPNMQTSPSLQFRDNKIKTRLVFIKYCFND